MKKAITLTPGLRNLSVSYVAPAPIFQHRVIAII